ncbi:uncharacterized protein DNG_07222 [Cephalotrichum gorgonifer]|uniref:DUF7729 domain-containing protein n=1 Tax=Cephalotrichum gorgonifer TaxID=2041049 RepID=A0AAE8N222_9PEZI|nr:uncharacterized protein DNG_07222 [Cephalotrichum gorgonifer]
MASTNPFALHRPRIQWKWPLLLFLATYLLLSTASAAEAPSPTPAPTERLLVDNSIPVLVDGKWVWMAEDSPELRRRRDDDDDEENGKGKETETSQAGEAKSTVTVTPIPTHSAYRKDGEETTSTETNPTPSPLPSPFDNNLDFNFTSNGGKSCPRFLNNLLTSDTFKSCYPISMMIQTSKSFFDATKELASIVTVLDATCAAPLDSCTTYLADSAAEMITPENCGQEYTDLQPNILQAYAGLNSYNVLYKATCLRRGGADGDGDGDDAYCFASAVTNTSTPANAYIYFLPLNMSLPKTAEPACGRCLRDTMAIYQAASAARSLGIAYTYTGAAERVNEVCGDGFVNATLPEALEDGARRAGLSGVAVGAALAVLFLGWL